MKFVLTAFSLLQIYADKIPDNVGCRANFLAPGNLRLQRIGYYI